MSLSALSTPNPRPKRVLIVGAGPSGLVTLRNLIERGRFDAIEVVERRDDVGGVW
jgi:cation diffusion facilitator CzcD-associated flavoprotein CzcO